MAIAVTFKGVTRNVQAITISSSQNSRDRCTIRYIVPLGGLVPTIDDEVIVTESSTRIFAGQIKQPTSTGLSGSPTQQIEASVNILDFNELADRQVISLTLASGTLKVAATALLAYLPGVTLSMTPSGPTLPSLTYENVTVTAILDDLCKNTGWLRNISYYKVLSFWEPGTWDAPWDVAAGDGNTVGDITVSRSRVDYANRIIVRFSDVARKAYAYVWMPSGNFANGETVTVGSKTYTFQDTLTDADGNVHISHVNGAGSLTNLGAAIRLTGGDYAASMTVHPQVTAWENRADLLTVQALAPGASGNSIAVSDATANSSWIGEGSVPMTTLLNGADEALTNLVTVNNLTEQGLYDVYTRVVDAPSIFSEVDALALGNHALARAIVVEETITYDTYRTGLVVGMTQQIVIPDREINASCLITDINWNMMPGNEMRRSVTARAGTVYDGSIWRDMYQTWSGTSSGGTTMSWGGGVSVAAPLRVVYTLGGSRSLLATPATSAWVPIAEWCPAKALESFEARVRCWLWAAHAGIEVQARLVSGTDGVTFGTVVPVVPEMDAVTSQTPVERSAAFTAGVNVYYRLEVKPTTAGEGCGCLGYLESA
jgi:hypothetical protein